MQIHKVSAMDIDAIIYEPIVTISNIEDWRILAKEITTYLVNHQINNNRHYDFNVKHPKGALMLEGLLELYHLHKQEEFYFNFYNRLLSSFKFNGYIEFGKYADGKFPRLDPNLTGYSIRELNLIPGKHSKYSNYIFSNKEDAETHAKDQP